MKILQKIFILKNRQLLGTFVEMKAKILIINFSKNISILIFLQVSAYLITTKFQIIYVRQTNERFSRFKISA